MTKVADYVIAELAAHGISEAFVVYGAANGDLIDAFTRTKNIRYVCAQHEQGAGFMAEGWAKVKGKPGCAIATSGPGGQNFVTPIANCYYDSVPAIFITGQIKTQFMRPSPEIRQIGFQECPIVDIVRPITKYAVTITDPSRIRYELGKALWLCRTGRPGPVLLDLPIDVQKTEIEPTTLELFDIMDPGTVEEWNYEVDLGVGRVLEALRHAERPMMLIGGGLHASRGTIEAFYQVADILQIPVCPTWNATDIVTDDLPYFAGRVGTYGGKGRNFGIQNCDLLICVGSRLSGRITGGAPETFARGAKKITVDIDPALLKTEYQQVPFDINIQADAGMFFARMLYRLRQGYEPRHIKWLGRCLNWKDQYDPVLPEHFERKDIVHPYAFLRRLSERLPENAIVVGDCGGNIVSLMHAFETKKGQRVITNNGNSPMGFSMAGAIGAWFADPSRPVVCIIGDGGMQMNIQELQTIRNYGCNIKVFIINNEIYGITQAFQEVNFEGRTEACKAPHYTVPDFLNVADAYGIIGAPIGTISFAKQCIQWTFDNARPWIIDVKCPDFHTYEPKIVGWKTPIEDMTPLLPREEFAAQMIVPMLGDETVKESQE